MSNYLAGKTALVTGASRGIGRMIALRLAAKGAHVCLHYGASQKEALALADEITVAGGRCFTVGADLADIGGLPAMVASVMSGFRAAGANGLDILVNNAGIGTMGAISDTDEALFDRLIDINMKAVFFTTRAALAHINDGGRIINLSSMVSLLAFPQCIAYSMSKAGVNAFTRSLALELGPRGITVNAIAPGITATDLVKEVLKIEAVAEMFKAKTALGRIGGPDDIAAVVAFLASADAGWVTGQVLPVNGGSDL